jgi:hypothetical protein
MAEAVLRGRKGVYARISPVPRRAPASIAAERAASSSSKSTGVAGDVDNDLVVAPRPDTQGPIARVIAAHGGRLDRNPSGDISLLGR